MNDSAHTPSSRRRKSARARNIVIAALVVVAGATWYGVHAYRAKAAQEGEYLYAAVQVGNVEDLVTATGTLEPREYVDVGAQVSGQIEKIHVEVGDLVTAGTILAEIDATTSEARVESNRARLKSSETNLLTQEANLEKAERDFQRQKNLFEQDATTREQYLNAQTSLENARRSVETSKLTIEQQKADMRIEENNLRYTKIIAPIDGTVMSIAVKEGQTINASQQAPTVLKLANLNTMTVRSDVSEADIAKLQVGMNVYFTTLGAGQNRRWYSTIKRREPTPKNQNSVVLYPVLFDVENEGNSLMPNMTTQVFFVVSQARNVLTVPMAALQQGQQIAREMAAKKQSEEQTTAATEAPAGAAPNMVAGGPAAGGSVPATSAGEASAPTAATAGAERGARGGGFGGGGRPGGGGFDPQNLTPEQREQMAARFQRGGGAGGFGGGGFGGAGGGANRQGQRRAGTVMVKLADGTLEPRRVVIGVTDRVYGEVLEGLEEGEEVVVGRREAEAAATNANQNQNQNQNNFRNGGFQGGNFRPF